jgi:hypothetical protein
MTRKLDELFDVESKKAKELEEKKDLIVVDDIPANLPVSEDELDQAVLNLTEVSQHESDMDSLAVTSMEAYEKIMEIADNVEEKNVGRILEAAVQMQRNAIDAKNSKLRARQKAAEILLKKKQIAAKEELEDAGVYEDDADEEAAIVGDRNKVLDMLKDKQ